VSGAPRISVVVYQDGTDAVADVSPQRSGDHVWQVQREVREETGLDVEPERLTGVYKNVPRGIVALVFRARIVGGSHAGATDEAAHIEWISPQEVQAAVTRRTRYGSSTLSMA
jgi:hypothetical protein